MAIKLFTPRKIENMSMSDIHKEYSRLRSIANKRIQRLTAQGLGTSPVLFPTIQQVQESSRWDVGSALADVSNFLRSERTTVSGEKKFLAHFQEVMIRNGYGDLVQSVEDIYKMIDFMDQMREQYGSKVFDSGDALDVLQQAQRLKIPIEKVAEKYEMFVTHLNELEDLKPSSGGMTFSQSRISNLIEKWS